MKSKVGRNISIFFCVLLIAMIAALYLYIYAIPDISGSLTETAVLSYGRLSVSNEAECLIVRSEKVYTAKRGGEISYYVKEGDKTRKGVKILDIYGGGSNDAYYCESTGFVSYYTDGFEDILTPETLEQIEPGDYISTEEKEARYSPNIADRSASSANEGDPVYKLISSDSWYVAAFVPMSYAQNYEWNRSVTVAFSDGTEMPGVISSTVEKGDLLLAVIQIKQYYPEFAKLRMEHVTIITQNNEGLLVPNSAIAEEDGKKGVYVKDINGDYNFTRVNIIVSTDTESLLTPDSFGEADENGDTVSVNTVEIYDEVLRNAEDK